MFFRSLWQKLICLKSSSPGSHLSSCAPWQQQEICWCQEMFAKSGSMTWFGATELILVLFVITFGPLPHESCLFAIIFFCFFQYVAMPCWDPDWRQRLKNFDTVFSPTTDASESRPQVQEHQADRDLAATDPVPGPTLHQDISPPSLTAADFRAKYPTVVTTVSVQMGSTISVTVVEGACYISSPAKVRMVGILADSPRPLLMYAGGSWISDSAKDI